MSTPRCFCFALCVLLCTVSTAAADQSGHLPDWLGKDATSCNDASRLDAAKASLAVAMALELRRLAPAIDLRLAPQGVELSPEGLSRCTNGCRKTRAILAMQRSGSRAFEGAVFRDELAGALTRVLRTAGEAVSHQLTLVAGPVRLDETSCGPHYVFQLDDGSSQPYSAAAADAFSEHLCFFGGGSCGRNPVLGFRTTSAGCPEGRTCVAIDPTDGDNSTSINIDTIEGAHLNDVVPFSAPSGQFTLVPYVNEQWDAFGEYSTFSRDFMAHETGIFRVCASLASFIGAFELDLFINGQRENAFAISKYGAATGCREVKLNEWDHLDVRVHQTSYASMYFPSNPYWNWLQVQFIDILNPHSNPVSTDNVSQFSAPSHSFTRVPYNTVLYDANGRFDASQGRFTAVEEDHYELCASLGGFSADFELDIFINGQRENAFAASKYGIAQGCRTFYLTAGSYAEVWMYQASGGPLTFYPNTYWSWVTLRSAETRVRINNISGFAAPHGAFTKVMYTTEAMDAGNEFDPGTSRITATRDEDVFVCASLAGFAGDFELDLFINGARSKAIAVSNNGAATGCRTVRLHWGDTLEVWMYQATGTTMYFQPNSYWNWLLISQAFTWTETAP